VEHIAPGDDGTDYVGLTKQRLLCRLVMQEIDGAHLPLPRPSTLHCAPAASKPHGVHNLARRRLPAAKVERSGVMRHSELDT